MQRQQFPSRPRPTEAEPALAGRRAARTDDEVAAMMQENASTAAQVESTTSAADEIEAEIAAILSENPEEFVIRFVQTIGQ